MSIPKNIKHLRNKFSKKQTEIAIFLGVAPNTYSNYENGNREIGIDDVIKLADYFGVSVESLVRGNLWDSNYPINDASNNTTADDTAAKYTINQRSTAEWVAMEQRIADLESQIALQKQIIELLQNK